MLGADNLFWMTQVSLPNTDTIWPPWAVPPTQEGTPGSHLLPIPTGTPTQGGRTGRGGLPFPSFSWVVGHRLPGASAPSGFQAAPATLSPAGPGPDSSHGP